LKSIGQLTLLVPGYMTCGNLHVGFRGLYGSGYYNGKYGYDLSCAPNRSWYLRPT